MPVDFGAGSPDTRSFSMQQITYVFPRSCLAIVALTLFTFGTALAQSPTPGAPSPTPAASATPAASPAPLSLAELTGKIVAAEEERGAIDGQLKSETFLPGLKQEAAKLSLDIEKRLAESGKILSSKPSLAKVREQERLWQERSEALGALKSNLTKRLETYQKQADALDEIQNADWAKLLKEGELLKEEWISRTKALVNAATGNRTTVQKRRADLTPLLSTVQKQERQINEMNAAIKQALPQAGGRLFVRESDPVWRIPIWSESKRLGAGLHLMQDWSTAWKRQWSALAAYAQAQSATFLIHAALFGALLSGLFWARRRVNAWPDDEPSLKQAAVVFEVPISMAIAFSLMAFHWIYPDAPGLLIAIAGAAALIPAILILRRLLDRHLFPVLNLLVVFYFIDQLRTVAAALPLVARLLFLAEMAGGLGFLAWLLVSGRLASLRQQDSRLAYVTLGSVRLALGVLFAALLANGMGCVELGNLVGDAALQSAYLAVVLYAATRIVDGFIIGALSTEPLSQLGMVRRHRTVIWRRTHRIFKALALLAWASETLNLLSLRSQGWEKGMELLWKEGSRDLTILGQLAAFGAVVWASFLLSRFIRFILEEDFYPRVHLERGLSYAVSTMLHYAVLLLGFYIAAAMAQIDMTKFNILIGAFGVGMGFGLQNIINNFVSGVILLFERPVKVGDVVQMDSATTGVVDRIGIRASIIRTGGGSEIIVPNGKLISDQVINWTLSNRQRGIDLPVSVAYDTEPCRVIELLKEVAAAHPLVSKRPAPNAVLAELGNDALQFKLTAWTDNIEQWGQIRSDLAIAIHAAFLKEGIRRPAPAPAAPATQP